MLTTWLTEEFGLSVPVLGAPMGGRAGGRLAGEVGRAGGLGMLGAARYTTPDWIAEEAEIARRAGGRVGVGLMTWSLHDDDSLLDAAIAAKPELISLSFGDPAPFIGRVKEAGIPVCSQVNSLADRREVEAAGVDFVIAQGTEAGGHTGRIATLPLLQQILEATDLPVVAAGGIATGRGLAAVLAAGAEGALIGTALLASPETTGPDYAPGKLVSADSADTVYTSVFDRAREQPWPSRWRARALVNDYTRRWHGHDAGIATSRLIDDYDREDPERGVVYAGQAAGLVRSQSPAAEVVERIGAQAAELLGRLR